MTLGFTCFYYFPRRHVASALTCVSAREPLWFYHSSSHRNLLHHDKTPPPQSCNILLSQRVSAFEPKMDPSHPALVPSAMGNPLINKLPPEIRSHVYGFVLAERVEVTAHQPGLLQTCRQIRSESKGIFYHDAKFEVTPTSMKGGALRVMGRWLKVVGYVTASLAQDQDSGND